MAQSGNPTQEGEKDSVSRRRVLAGISGASIAGLAGCMSGSSENLGERVPEVIMASLGGAKASTQENMMPTVQKNTQEALGINVSIKPMTFTTMINDAGNDKRTHHMSMWWNVNNTYRLDPHEITQWFLGYRAGEKGSANWANYASCDYTKYAVEQAQASSKEERREKINKSQEVISNDCMSILLTPNLTLGTWREDEVTINGVGDAGLTRSNPNAFIKSESADGSQISVGVSPPMFQTNNFLTQSGALGIAVWSRQIHSPLLLYNEDLELVPYLAKEEPEIENDFQTFRFALRDATFHNGDPITAEHVKFTFEQMIRGSEAGAYTKPTRPPYEEINVIDEKTIEFNFEEPFPPFDTAVVPRWGILHKPTWVDAGAVESPGNANPEGIVGSGAFQLEEFNQGNYMDTVPFEDHPVQTPAQGVFWRAYRESQTAFSALENNEIQIKPNISPGISERAEDSDAPLGINSTAGHMPMLIYPQFPYGPQKFEEFRKAWAAAIDREQLNQVAYRGKASPELYAGHFTKVHPWRAPEEMLYKMAEPGGSPEKAKEILEEAGWSWDNDGNLHYPEDADLSPRWEQGDAPMAEEEFSCLEEYT